jgi:hypothetical protein
VFNGLRQEQRVLVRMTLGAAFLSESRRGRRPGLVSHLAVGVARPSTQVWRGASVCEGVGPNSLGLAHKASSRVRGCLLSAQAAAFACKWSPQLLSVASSIQSGSSVAKAYRQPVATVARNRQPSNNGMQLTKAARCAPRATTLGQSLRAAFAADPECSAVSPERSE